MAATFSFGIAGERLDISIRRSLYYPSTQLIIREKSGEVVMEATDDQLAEIKDVLCKHLDQNYYPYKRQEGAVCRRL